MITPGRFQISPEKCLYGIADPKKIEICKAHGFPHEFEALGITNEKQDRTIAIIPLDDSSIENARLLAMAPEMLQFIKDTLNCINPNLSPKHEILAVVGDAIIAAVEGKIL